MRRFPDYQPKGVIPATLLAFDEDFSINERETRRHLTHVAGTRGLSAITVNGHASEVLSCSEDEQKQVLTLTLDEIGDRLPIVNGIFAPASLEAARLARMADAAGASALLVAPPDTLHFGGQLRPEMALTHFRHIADATDLPIILFQYPMGTGLGYPFETLLQLLDEIPSIRAIKDWTNDGMLHERQTRELQSRDRPVSVLTTHSAWLMSSLTMGAQGLLSGSGSIIADLQVAVFEAVQANDLKRARAINDRIYPLAQAFYAAPALDMHNRMKECLKLLGRLDKAVVRPPLCKLPEAEIRSLEQALKQAGIQREGAFQTEPALASA